MILRPHKYFCLLRVCIIAVEFEWLELHLSLSVAFRPHDMIFDLVRSANRAACKCGKVYAYEIFLARSSAIG